MRLVVDFHIHSRFARATSKRVNLESLDEWAQKKGISVMGTGDFTHPLWLKELKEQLEPAEQGLYKLKPSFAKATEGKGGGETRFVFTSEISCIYSKGGKVRKVHLILVAPSLDAVEKINTQLAKIGNIASDGRPILGLDAKEAVRIALEADPTSLVVPAHCLPSGSLVHTKNELTKPIEDIKEGDLVYTHQNRWRSVTKVFKRPYKGKLYRVRPYYFREGLSTTPEHPFYVLKTQKHCKWQHGFCHPSCSGRSHCCKKHQAAKENFSPKWISAEQLEKGNVLLFPRFPRTKDIQFVAIKEHLVSPSFFGGSFSESKIQEEVEEVRQTITMTGTRTKEIPAMLAVDKHFCRLVGYFLAEGSVGRDLISFTFADHETMYHAEVRNLAQKVFGILPSKERTKEGSLEIIYYSKILKELFASFCYEVGANEHRAFTKMLPQWALELPTEKQVEILRGWWRGDAGYTSSRSLMNQMKILFLRLGILPSIYVDDVSKHKARGNHFYGNREIEARYDGFAMTNLAFFEDRYNLQEEPEFSRFIPKTSIRHGWLDENYVYLPIRDIETTDYNGEVYNLEVEEDNSYTSEFATVHNCWTPWFSVFGSKSGFNSLQECFDEYTKYIYAIETGLSSDPQMNWRLSALDDITLLSNSDSHSLEKLGREANVFDTELNYSGIREAIVTKDPKKFLYTIEFFPEEGKYHYDGHRLCNVVMSPEQSKKQKNMCHVCKRPLTIGVLNRVAELADRKEGAHPKVVIPYKSLIPLQEIIADAMHQGVGTKKGKAEYEKLIERFGNEFAVLLDAKEEDLESVTLPEIAEGIMRVREGKVTIEPGYDGEYGKIKIL
ncbi:MAG: hypothetical protein O3C23_01455 [bacterium]|nr:hypothetical protein [bacterium]